MLPVVFRLSSAPRPHRIVSAAPNLRNDETPGSRVQLCLPKPRNVSVREKAAEIDLRGTCGAHKFDQRLDPVEVPRGCWHLASVRNASFRFSVFTVRLETQTAMRRSAGAHWAWPVSTHAA